MSAARKRKPERMKTEMISMNTEKLLIDIVDRYEAALKDNLVGLYLHGSLAMGCFTPKADIDLIAVVKRPMEFSEKRKLIDRLSEVGPLPEKGLEMSVVLEDTVRNIIHPMPFELHYSYIHKKRYETDQDYLVGGTTDRDLAAHLTLVKHRGVRLYGKPIDEVIGDVPKEYFIDAVIYDIGNAVETIKDDPVNVILNLCRTLYYLKKGMVASKLEGGYWCTGHAAPEYKELVSEAVRVYVDAQKKMERTPEELEAFASYMLGEILPRCNVQNFENICKA